MQQRQPRLGDILDDYCPRERRITNHAVVAMINQAVKQTRCTTCDAEHDYRHARLPPSRKKKDTNGALYQEVLAGMPRKGPAPSGADAPEVPTPPSVPEPRVEEAAAEAGAAVEAEPERAEEEEGPVHRQLIRATLPRPDGQVPARPAPEFTMRQPIARPGRFRDGSRGPQQRMGNTRGTGFGFRSEARPHDRHTHGNRSGNHAPGRPGRHAGGSGGRPGKKRSR